MSYLKKIEYEIVMNRKNKVEIDFDRLNYDFVNLFEVIEPTASEEETVITINNAYQLKIAPEKQIAVVLGLSRSQVKSVLETGEMELKINGGVCTCRLKHRNC